MNLGGKNKRVKDPRVGSYGDTFGGRVNGSVDRWNCTVVDWLVCHRLNSECYLLFLIVTNKLLLFIIMNEFIKIK